MSITKVTLTNIEEVLAGTLLGRGAAAGDGDLQTITLGSNLALVGTTLHAAAGTSTNAFGAIAVSGQADVVAEAAPDTLTLVAGANVTITTDAAADAITIAAAGGTSTNAFGTILVSGQADVVAEAAPDTLTLVAGANVTITTDAATDTIMIAAAAGTSYTDEEAQDAVGGILVDSSTIDFTYDDTPPSITAQVAALSINTTHLANGGVTNAKLRDSNKLSVIGRSVDTIGVPSDIGAVQTLGAGVLGYNENTGTLYWVQSDVADRLLTSSGMAASWGQAATNHIADKAVTNDKLRDSAALTVIGRASDSVGAPADIAADSDHRVLRRLGTNLGFGAMDLSQAAAVTNRLGLDNLAAGTDNHVLTGTGTGSPAYEALPTATSGQAVLSANFNITVANGTYQDSGLKVTLPAAGTYFLSADLRGFLLFTAGGNGRINARLYNETDGAAVPGSDREVIFGQATGTNYEGTGPLTLPVTVDGAKVIRVEATSLGATTWTSRGLGGGSTTMQSSLSYVKLAH